MTMPWGLGPARSTPSTRTVPRSGRSKPAMMFISVDLPQPEGPDDRDELAVADVEADVGDHRQQPLAGGEALGDAVDDDLASGHSATSRS
jgi:hypothetical protein